MVGPTDPCDRVKFTLGDIWIIGSGNCVDCILPELIGVPGLDGIPATWGFLFLGSQVTCLV